jgi:hypothetical protein
LQPVEGPGFAFVYHAVSIVGAGTLFCVDEWAAAYTPEPYPLWLLLLVGSPCRLQTTEIPRVSMQPPTIVADAMHPEPQAAGDADPVPIGDVLLPVTLNFLPT